MYTAIVYLDDVPPDAGGATTLVLASDARNVSVQPKRGRALLFLASTAHAGEPLLRGRKRIVNQWVYEAEQSPLASATWLVADAEQVAGADVERPLDVTDRCLMSHRRKPRSCASHQ